jgi:hypothetical protein
MALPWHATIAQEGMNMPRTLANPARCPPGGMPENFEETLTRKHS